MIQIFKMSHAIELVLRYIETSIRIWSCSRTDSKFMDNDKWDYDDDKQNRHGNLANLQIRMQQIKASCRATD